MSGSGGFNFWEENDTWRRDEIVTLWLASFSAFAFVFYFEFEVLVFFLYREYSPNPLALSGFIYWVLLYLSMNDWFYRLCGLVGANRCSKRRLPERYGDDKGKNFEFKETDLLFSLE